MIDRAKGDAGMRTAKSHITCISWSTNGLTVSNEALSVSLRPGPSPPSFAQTAQLVLLVITQNGVLHDVAPAEETHNDDEFPASRELLNALSPARSLQLDHGSTLQLDHGISSISSWRA